MRDETSRRRDPSYLRPTFPYWVIHGAGGRHSSNSQSMAPRFSGDRAHRRGGTSGGRSGSGRAERPHAGASSRKAPTPRTGRTGVDLRARMPSAPRPVAPPPRSHRRLTLPWRRGRQSQHPLLSPPQTEAGKKGGRGRRSALALVGLIVVQAILLSIIVWGLTSPTFHVHYVEIQGTDDPTLIAAIQRLPLTGCNIFRCDLTRRVQLVEALPAVAQAQVHTVYPDGLLVTVTPRRPTLLWQSGAQQIVIASDGTVLGPLASDPVFATLPLLTISDPAGVAFAGRIPPPGYQMPADEAEMAGQLRTGITRTLGGGWTLQWTADAGFVATDGSGNRVVFGTPTDAAQALSSYPDPAALASAPAIADVDRGVAAQLDMLHAIRTRLAQSAQQAVLIDLRWGPHPYYRLANGG